MLIHGKMERSGANGPGERAVIWTQGCSLGCKGCQNPETHKFLSVNEKDVYGLVDWVLGIEGIEGLTLSGGEPMQQVDSLFLLVTLLHEKRPDLSIGMFTGYTEKELESGRWRWHSRATGDWLKGDGAIWAEIKKHLDFAIMGRYNQLVRSNDKPLCGSRNQEVIFFTNRYSQKDLKPTMVEFEIDSDLVTITGFPPPEEEIGDPVHA
jgi:anaerobic ribonucleoside-triphosphate reductase activating protein